MESDRDVNLGLHLKPMGYRDNGDICPVCSQIQIRSGERLGGLVGCGEHLCIRLWEKRTAVHREPVYRSYCGISFAALAVVSEALPVCGLCG
jgi:hypothetical protein